MPFAVASVQIAFILINESKELATYYQKINSLLTPVYRCQLYNKSKQVNLNILQADKEGCPFKIILGNKELEQKEITLVRRDNVERRISISQEDNEIEQKYRPIFEKNLTKLWVAYS